MSSVKSQQTPRSNDPGAMVALRAGKLPQGEKSPDAAKFAGMVAASQRKLEAERLAAKKDNSATASQVNTGPDARDNESETDESTASCSAQDAPAAQDDTQAQAQAVGTSPSAAHAAQIRASSEESPDWLQLASLLPDGVDDGVFEVLMPSRGKVGVAVSDMPDGLSYLLMPEDDSLSDRLRSNEMELEDLLKRRIRRNVKVVVL